MIQIIILLYDRYFFWVRYNNDNDDAKGNSRRENANAIHKSKHLLSFYKVKGVLHP